MLDVGPTTATGNAADDADLAVFVDRLAAAGSDRSTARAQAQVRRAISDGAPPPGLRRLAEALAASVGGPPAPRRPDEAASVVAAVRSTALVVLEEYGPDAVAGAVAALLADSRRVLVTAAGRPELDAVRSALPDPAAARSLDRLPALPPAEMRRLRALLATSTPERRARRHQDLPADDALLPVDEVETLCRQATGGVTGGGLLPQLLSDLDPVRRDAVTSVARCVDARLATLRELGSDWTWPLLSELVHSRHRAVLDRMLEDTAQARVALERARSAPSVTFTGELPQGADEALRRYLAFLEAGGRSRQYFRSAPQREVQPVLRLVRVDDEVPETAEQVYVVLQHVELAQRLRRIQAGCAEMGIPGPRGATDLDGLTEALVAVAAAARSVGALRHDVLFIHPNSPVAVPDLDAARDIATAILEFADRGSATEAGDRLDRAAAELAARAPVRATAPEHERVVAALRGRDAAAYADAVEALVAARREVQDERRSTELIDRLRRQAPRLAQAWEEAAESGRTGLGLASFLPLEQLLEGLPEADSADVVVVLGAARLGVERLLVTAAAPRLIAVVGPGERPAGEGPTLLGVLQRAAAVVIRAGRPAGGRVLPLAARGAVGRAGA